MLKQLFPKTHQHYLSSPLLGPILNGYDEWLSQRKYAHYTWQHHIRMALLLDHHLRKLGLENLSDISADILHDLWARYHVDSPNTRSLGGVIRTADRVAQNWPGAFL